MVRNIKLNFKASCLGMVLAASTAFAGQALADVQAGVVKYEAGDYAGAIQDWLPLASENDPNALFNLGQVYRLGRGVEKDMAAARNYYERAARLGHVSAQGNLGTLYFFAEDTALKDQEKAVSWWQEAATNGDARSQYMLGVLFFNGDVVGRDWTRAYAWMSLAASAGLPEASQAETSMLKHMTAAQVADAREISSTLVNPTGAFPNSMPVQFERSSTPINPATAKTASVTSVQPVASLSPEPVDDTPTDPALTQEGVEPAVAQVEAQAPGAPTETAAAAGSTVQTAAVETATPEPDYSAPDVDFASEPVADAAAYAFKLQLASFSSESKARSAWDQVASKHSDVLASLSADVVQADLGERGIFYRLYANGFVTKSDAREACKALKAAGQGCFIVSNK